MRRLAWSAAGRLVRRDERVRHLLRGAARCRSARRRPPGERADARARAQASRSRSAGARPVLSIPMRLAGGDLGESFLTQEAVTTIVARDLPVTASLALGASVLWLVIGVGAGVIAATRRRSAIDRAITGVALAFYSMPTFLLGQLLLFFLFFQLYLAGFELFPPGSYVAVQRQPAAVGAFPHSAVAVDCARHRSDLLASHARRDARRARRGLHSDGTREGHSPSGGSRIACAAQLAHAGGEPVRHRPRQSDGRRDRDRSRVRLAGPRPRSGAGDRDSGSADHHGDHDPVGGAGRGREPRSSIVVQALLDPRVRLE